MIFNVENIKCGGCANGITQKLLSIDIVNNVSVDIEIGQVTVDTVEISENHRNTILAVLTSMGYPEKGSVEGLSSVKAKATSYVSCAIGKMTD